MKNLKLYETSAEFQAYEISAGGDGITTKTIIPGVSYTKAQDITYFNPYLEAPLLHEVTVNYLNVYGDVLVPSDTKQFLYYSGVSSEQFIHPLKIDGYTAKEDIIPVSIPEDTSVDIIYGSPEDIQKPLTFIILSSGTLNWKCERSASTRTISYRINSGEWTEWTSTLNADDRIFVQVGDKVEFKGENAMYCDNAYTQNSGNTFSGSTALFNICGNIMSLMYGDDFADETTFKDTSTCGTTNVTVSAFGHLFRYCDVIDASSLILPATSLKTACYINMFYCCDKLVKGPELPAEKLAPACYRGMFWGCTNLKKAPKLKATKLTNAASCYYNMFTLCKSLKECPQLPADTLAPTCYCEMFRGCDSLTAGTKLIATTLSLAGGCYQGMFKDCINLVKAPELPATMLSGCCYSGMFQGCTSLLEAPDLPATVLPNYYCYGGMFSGCTSLVKPPKIMATACGTNGFSNMFQGCWNLTKAPDFITTSSSTKSYKYLFCDAKKLTYIKCLLETPTTARTQNWVSGVVSTTGLFVKKAGVTGWVIGVHGIPFGWSVVDDDSMGSDVSKIDVINGESGSTTIKLYNGTNIPWTATSDSSWLTLNEYTSDEELTELVVSYDENLNGTPRTGSITVTNGLSSFTITVADKSITNSTYLTFEILSAGTINWKTSKTGSTWSKTISYRLNNGSWSSITPTTSGVKINVVSGDVVEFRGSNSNYGVKYVSGNITLCASTFNGTTARFNVYGNIMSLINSTNYSTLTGFTNNYTFVGLFSACTGLMNAKYLILPATDLSSYCYAGMFAGCSSLTYAPAILPATNYLYDEGCYYDMFSGCTSMMSGPVFTMSQSVPMSACCQMFARCKNLTRSDATLSSTSTSGGCYYGMFYGCESLTVPPTINASTMRDYSCASMFKECTSLVEPPALTATTLYPYCYANMFEGCINLKTVPTLPGTTLGERCYYYMFCACKSITDASNLKISATTIPNGACMLMFSGCTNLTVPPELPGKNLGEYAYNQMFYGCENLTTAPNLPATALSQYCYQSMFMDCRRLVTPNPVIPAAIIPMSACSRMFWGCINLLTAPVLEATEVGGRSYGEMFYNCSRLKNVPQLPATTLSPMCYHSMFCGCASLTAAPELPALTLPEGAYYSMFSACYGLTTVQGIMAETMATSACCQSMFNSCLRLNYVKCLATDISGTDCTKNWLNRVPGSSDRIFVKHPNMSSWTTGVNGIPEGWTVQDATI